MPPNTMNSSYVVTVDGAVRSVYVPRPNPPAHSPNAVHAVRSFKTREDAERAAAIRREQRKAGGLPDVPVEVWIETVRVTYTR